MLHYVLLLYLCAILNFFADDCCYANEAVITYGDLIDLYDLASSRAQQSGISIKDELIKLFHETFPFHNLTSRPERYLKTVERIVAPTKPSLKGPSKLNDSDLLTYCHTIWKPRVGNPTAGQYIMTEAMHASSKIVY